MLRWLARLMRLMTSMGLCTTTSRETYMGNSKTTAFGAPIGNDGVQCMYVFCYLYIYVVWFSLYS